MYIYELGSIWTNINVASTYFGCGCYLTTSAQPEKELGMKDRLQNKQVLIVVAFSHLRVLIRMENEEW